MKFFKLLVLAIIVQQSVAFSEVKKTKNIQLVECKSSSFLLYIETTLKTHVLVTRYSLYFNCKAAP